jgi:hypothetical protein
MIMLRKVLLVAVAAILATLLTSSRAQAWGCYHYGYTHVGPSGAYHVGGTYGGYGGYGGYRYGGGYHYGYGGYGGYHAGYYRAW